MLVNQEQLNSISEDDVFIYDKHESSNSISTKKQNQSKNSQKKNDLINNLKKNLVDAKDSQNYKKKREKISWMKCLRRITTVERTRYCNHEFNSMEMLQKKCEVIYIS